MLLLVIIVVAYSAAWAVGMWAFYSFGWRRGFDDAQAAQVLARKFMATGRKV